MDALLKWFLGRILFDLIGCFYWAIYAEFLRALLALALFESHPWGTIANFIGTIVWDDSIFLISFGAEWEFGLAIIAVIL